MELTAAEPRRRGLTQLYIDGEPAVRVDTETFLQAGWRLGQEIADEELRQLIAASDARRAQEKALTLLEYRSHSKKELTEKIARSAASWEAAQAAADRMEELGLVDDAAYAANLAKELFTRKRYGPARVRAELRRKGVAPEIADGLLAEYDDEGQRLENIQWVLERKYAGWREDERTRRRAFDALRRLGYPYDLIRQALTAPED